MSDTDLSSDPGDSRDDQDRRMREVLTAMQLLTYGPAQNLEPQYGTGKPSGGNRPPGDSNPLHLIWAEKYERANTDDQRETVIAEATDELVAARRRTTPVPKGETPDEWEARVIKTGKGYTAREAAVHFRTGTLAIVRLRRKYGCDPNTGEELEGELSPRLLAERGMTARQIAMVCGCSPGTAQYHVNRARQAA